MTREWVELGDHAHALADGERIKGVLYWTPGGVGEQDGPGGERWALPAAFFYVPADNVSQHKHVLESGADDWERAFEEVGALLQAGVTAEG